MRDASIVYINSSLHNDGERDIPCEYGVTLNNAIVDRSGDYQLAIVRFSIPNTQAIFTFEENKYFLTLTYNNVDYQQVVRHIETDKYLPLKKVHTFQQFIDSINIAFEAAFATLKAANPLAPPTEAPYMIYEPDTDFFSLITQATYAGANTIEIFFNVDLHSFFYNSFKVERYGVNLPNQKDIRFMVSDERNNTPAPGYLEMRQQFVTLFDWYDFQSIIFSTSGLPIRSEFITTSQSNGDPIYQPILTDFIPDLGKDRGNFIYNANPYRMVDLTGDNPVKRFDFRVLYVNRAGKISPLTIPPGYGMSVKFAFIKKQ